MRTHISQWAIGIALLVGLLFAAFWFGAAFRANTLLFALVWIAVPVFACFLNCTSVSSCFTLIGLQRVQAILMAVVIAISIAMFANDYHIRDRIGARFVEGYAHWRAESEIDDSGKPYYPGDDWTAKNSSGRLVIKLFELALFAAEIGLPVVTWKASGAAIHKKSS